MNCEKITGALWIMDSRQYEKNTKIISFQAYNGVDHPDSSNKDSLFNFELFVRILPMDLLRRNSLYAVEVWAFFISKTSIIFFSISWADQVWKCEIYNEKLPFMLQNILKMENLYCYRLNFTYQRYACRKMYPEISLGIDFCGKFTYLPQIFHFMRLLFESLPTT